MRTLFVLLFTTSLAYGQTQRTFVSAHTGSDANPCGPTTPCRSFGAAMALTLSGGEIIVLDSGGYGTVTIDKSVSIVSPAGVRSEEHTSELQSLTNLVCRLLLEKKKKNHGPYDNVVRVMTE